MEKPRKQYYLVSVASGAILLSYSFLWMHELGLEAIGRGYGIAYLPALLIPAPSAFIAIPLVVWSLFKARQEQVKPPCRCVARLLAMYFLLSAAAFIYVFRFVVVSPYFGLFLTHYFG